MKSIKIVYTNPECCILNNGITEPYSKLNRGVQQGDPLAPYVFIPAIKLLAMTIAFKDNNFAQKIFAILKSCSTHSGIK